MTDRSRARLKLVAIVALFAAPILVSLLLVGVGWRPVAARNHGTLIEPAQDFRGVQASGADGAAIAWNDAAGHWRVLLRLPESCGSACPRTIDALQRVWLGLGSKAPRVEVLVANARDRATLDALALFPRARAVTLAAVPLPPPPPGDPTYLPVQVIDPHGYYVLRYDTDFDPVGLRKDLRRLLR